MVSKVWFPDNKRIEQHRATHECSKVCPELPGWCGLPRKGNFIDYEAFKEAYPHVAKDIENDSRVLSDPSFKPIFVDLYQQGYAVEDDIEEIPWLDDYPWLMVLAYKDDSTKFGFMGFEVDFNPEFDVTYLHVYDHCHDFDGSED